MRLKIEVSEADLERYLGDIDCEAAHAARRQLLGEAGKDETFVQEVARLMDESMKVGVRIGARLQAEYATRIPGSELEFIFTESAD